MSMAVFIAILIGLAAVAVAFLYHPTPPKVSAAQPTKPAGGTVIDFNQIDAAAKAKAAATLESRLIDNAAQQHLAAYSATLAPAAPAVPNGPGPS